MRDVERVKHALEREGNDWSTICPARVACMSYLFLVSRGDATMLLMYETSCDHAEIKFSEIMLFT